MRSDLRDALRSLMRDRGFTVLAVVLLALVIGATVGVYAVLNAVVLRPMAFAHQAQTVVIWERDMTRHAPVVEVALGEVDTWRHQGTSFGDIGVFGSVNWSLTLVDGDARTRVPYSSVSASFFSIVGTPPAHGRVLREDDDAGNSPRTAVISDRLWNQYFGASSQALGRIIHVQLDAQSPMQSLEIVGVMPAAFDFPSGAMLWLPAAPAMRSAAQRAGVGQDEYLADLKVFYAIGRLRAGAGGATKTQAQQELSGIIRHTARGGTGVTSDAVVTAIDDYLLGPAKPVLWTMLAGALLMMLLGCSSVAGLQMFRAAQRDRALAIRLALGASRGRLIRQSLVESALLATAATIGAAGVSSVVTRSLMAAAPLDVPRLIATRVGAPEVLAAMAALAILVSVISGIWPAVFIHHVNAGHTLTSGARTAMHPRERLLQRLVVGWQVAVAVVLLSGAALFIRSVQRLNHTALGFDAERLLTAEIEPAANDLDRWDQFFDTLLSRTTELPHVTSAAAVSLRPLTGPIGNDTIPVLEGQAGLEADAPWRANPLANIESVTPGYFRTLGTRVLAGRDFSPGDRAAAPNVVIVSASAAARYWPGRGAVGQPILVATQRAPGSLEQPRWQTVVGVVEDVRYRGITDPRLDVYLPAAQSTVRVRHLLVRTIGDRGQLAADLRALARNLDPAVHISEIVTMTDVVARQGAPWRFAMQVLSAFGAAAALLATVGLVGFVSLVVALRRRELGIRAALGATPQRLRAHVLSEALWTAAIATAAGVFGALALGRLVATLLVGIAPHDPVSLAGAAILTLLAAGIGCLLPAQRAATCAPAEALRE